MTENSSNLPSEPPALNLPDREEVRNRLAAAIGRLLQPMTPGQMGALMKEIQQLRLADKLIGELLRNELSEEVYKEMVLTARMMRDLGTDLPAEDPVETQERAEQEIRQLGVEASQAATLVRLFEKLGPGAGGLADESPGAPEPPSDYEPPE